MRAGDRKESDVERAARQAAERVLMSVMEAEAEIREEHEGRRMVGLNTPDGRVRFWLKPEQSAYLYYESGDGWMFCYTPWKDEDGNYWSWAYKPIGPGSQSGDASQWKMVRLSKAAKRKTARKRAERMHAKRAQD